METQTHSGPGLYRRALGDSFDCLPPALRNFHRQPEEAIAQGSLRVTRGQGWLRSSLAALLRLPAPGEHVPIHLRVKVCGEMECWIRDFGSLRLVTRQWLQNGLLVEAAGPLRFGFHLSATTTGMRFEFVRCWLLHLPLPALLAPRINARAAGYQEGWWVEVCIEAPGLGMITQYEGKVTPPC